MTKYLAGVLTVIAVGVLAVAYGLLAPGRAMSATDLQAAAAPYQVQGLQPSSGFAQPVAQQVPVYGQVLAADVAVSPARPVQPAFVTYAGQPAQVVTYAPQAAPAQVVTYVPASAPYVQAPVASAPRPVQTVSYEPEPRARTSSRRVVVEREPRRDWRRTAMIVGGSTAAGAGVGGIFGGKKGALIGAAIAGGASTIYQTAKRD